MPVAAIGLCAIGIVFTLTRQVWLAAAVGTIVAGAVVPKLRVWLVPGTALALIGVVGLLAFVPGFGDRAQSRLDDRSPVWDRLNSNAAGCGCWASGRSQGWGWYAFADASRTSTGSPPTGR